MTNLITICGSLRKGSYNRMVMNLLPGLAPAGMAIKESPSFAEFPLYNADIQNTTGFPAAVNVLADAIRAADGVIFCTPVTALRVVAGETAGGCWVMGESPVGTRCTDEFRNATFRNSG